MNLFPKVLHHEICHRSPKNRVCNEFCLVIFRLVLVVVLGVFFVCFVFFSKFKIYWDQLNNPNEKKSHMKKSRPFIIINIIIERRFDNLPGSPVMSCIVYM